MAVWALFFLFGLYGLGAASHFRGAIIQWKPVDAVNYDGQVSIYVHSAIYKILFLLLS